MATGTKLEKTEPIPTGLKLEAVNKMAEHDMASRKVAMRPDTTPSIPSRDAIASTKAGVDMASNIKAGVDMESYGQHALYNAPTSTYGYYYPGYGGTYPQLDDHGYFQADASHLGMQSDNGSMMYYMPAYNPYSSGAVVGVDGQTVGQQQFYPSEYLQQPVSYGSEALPLYHWDSTYLSDTPNGNAGFPSDNYNSRGAAATTLPKSNGLNSMKTSGTISGKYPRPNSTQPTRPLNKVQPLGSDYSAGLLKGYNNGVGKLPPFSGHQKHLALPQYGSLNYRQNARAWNVSDDRSRSRYNRTQRHGSFESSNELSCGPRGAANRGGVPTDPTAVKNENVDSAASLFRSDQYNAADFETVYESAKFYIIKSYSEDDIHKSIKYNVWSSTPNGNKKLDAAFRDSEEKSSESGKKCPVFLFFSVNGSGQFVGLAEMTGLVDFNKDMDFWQVDKWSGFFPLKWHIIKDIPNTQLRHIVLENNDNRPVTFSRDTQEIGLKQGLEMLTIFKTYVASASLLDDFNFYEDREKSLQAKKNKPATLRMEVYEKDGDDEFTNHRKATREKKFEDPSSLINLTKNLSLNGYQSKKSSATTKATDGPVPAVAAP